MLMTVSQYIAICSVSLHPYTLPRAITCCRIFSSVYTFYFRGKVIMLMDFLFERLFASDLELSQHFCIQFGAIPANCFDDGIKSLFLMQCNYE